MSGSYVLGLVQGFTLAAVLVAVGYGIETFVRRLRARAQTAAGQPPRPIDPQDPPQFAIYERTDDALADVCSCHNRPVADGDRVLIWPRHDILCRDSYEGANL